MKILHYTLGLPPYRSGGLTKYTIDLMKEQASENDVYLLFPGRITRKNTVDIKFYKNFNNIMVYELINPLPVPLLNGILDIGKYTNKIDDTLCFDKYLDNINPDIIHIHTFMGLPMEFLKVAKQRNIKITFTTHDYFGLCPKVNFINNFGNVCDGDVRGCLNCNSSAYSMKKICIMQSRLYRYLKGLKIFKYFKKLYKYNNYKLEKKLSNDNQEDSFYFNYKNLRRYYINMFKYVDYIHFNSYIAKNIYSRFGISNGDVISITHNDITDNRTKDFKKNKKLNILFLGPVDEYKGLPMLLNALKEVKNGWSLNVYGNNFDIFVGDFNGKVNLHGKYKIEDLKNIMKEHDLLIVPSIWYETFGFILLEGLSNGMPIIATNTIGASYLIKDNKTGYIINPNKDDLTNKIKYLINNKEELIKINKNICNEKFKFNMKDHNKDIIKFYKNILESRG